MLNKSVLKDNLNLVCTISAPAGTGKTTLVHKLMQINPKVKQSITCTTRSPRGDEVNGVDYIFVSKDVFESMIKTSQLLEHVSLYGNYYGTPIEKVNEIIGKGYYAILVIDVQGALVLKKLYPGIQTIFIQPPSLKILENRLRGRNTESEESIKKRLSVVERELSVKDQFDHCIINDDLDKAVSDLNKFFV